MSATCTLTAGPNNLGPNMKIATYSVLLDSSYPATTGEAIDISGEFDYVHYAACGANDTLADNLKKYDVIHPGAGTAVTSSNVLITVNWSADGTDGEDFITFTNGGSLAAIGELQVVVIGS